MEDRSMRRASSGKVRASSCGFRRRVLSSFASGGYQCSLQPCFMGRGKALRFPMTYPRLSVAFSLLLLALPAGAQTAAPEISRTEDVVYGRKFGVALTLDVVQPAKPNGYGIVYMISGGWVSNHNAINPKGYAPYLDRGYTIFAVCHGCQPKFIIPEITQDIHRSIRFIRHNAAKWG